MWIESFVQMRMHVSAMMAARSSLKVSIRLFQYDYVLFMHTAVDCGILLNPENGMVIVTATTFDSTASYSCNGSNYLLVGAAERTCQANGMWSESVPQCSELRHYSILFWQSSFCYYLQILN